MIELRWLKGNWEFGKFKLQYRYKEPNRGWGNDAPWTDVPVVEEKKPIWCKHNLWKVDGWEYDQNGEPIEDGVMYCDRCGAKRPS